MSVLVLAEHNNAELNPATLNTITAASEIGGDITVLVSGSGCAAVADAAASVAGVSKVMLADSEEYTNGIAENMIPLIMAMLDGVTHLMAPANTYGKNILPGVAAMKDVAQISDIIRVDSSDTFQRPIYAGNALATVQSADALKVITVRSTAFEAAAETGGSASVEAVSATGDTGKTAFVKSELSSSDRPELASAKIVISGGRGMQDGSNFTMLEKVADKLGAAVGASRAAVDAGFVPNDYQVGQTGKVVAPDLYVAVGISGAIQHLAGMKDSKVIVAINKDEEAPIFQVADYGLIDDLFEAVPAMEKELG